MRRARFLLLFLVAIVVTACLEAAPFVPKIDEVSFDPSLGVDLSVSTETESGLWYRDITVGSGPQVRVDSGGDTVSVRYRGYLRNGYEFDTNIGAGLPVLRFTTGTGEVIDGFDEGVRGMRLGGVRQLIVPPSMGYGGQRNGDIPPHSILIFRVEVVDVDTASTS